MPDLEDLIRAVCPVASDAASLEAVAGDKSGRTGRAAAVARPRSTEEVAAVLRLANEHGFPVVPRAAGTGRTGGAVPERGGAVLDLMAMDRIVEIDEREQLARVEPGVRLGALQEAVEAVGLAFPPDPASAADCAVGGAIAMSAGGLSGAKYGTIKHYVLGLTVVLPSGAVIRTGARTRKCVTGYDMTSLFVGSEGTLGVVTEATLKLVPRPEARGTIVAWFDDDVVARAAVDAALDVRAVPRGLEFVDSRALGAVAAYLGDDAMAARRAMILVESDGSPDAVESELELFEQALRAAGAASIERAAGAQADHLWTARRSISPAVSARWPHRFAEDVCVPRARFAEMIGDLHRIAASHGLEALGFGHAGDGNIHASILMQGGDAPERARARKAVAEVFQRALELGGTLTAEHGIAMTKREYLPLELSPENRAAQMAIKRALDPNGILNPGKIFPEDVEA
jgi:glycolate dehydrogenase FAD-linked subunit